MSLNINIFTIIAIIAPAPEYLNIFTDIVQIRQKAMLKGQDTIESRPKNEATPLPPLKFSHKGKIWPIIEKIPQIDPTSEPKYLINI